MNDGLDHIRNHLLETGQATQDLLDYLDDRMLDIVSDKLAQCIGDLEENLLEQINKRRMT